MSEQNSERIYFGNIKEAIEPPNLIEVQLNSYVDFLQKDVPFSRRKNQGLQAVFKEVFPIESYDEKAVLDFSHFEIDRPGSAAGGSDLQRTIACHVPVTRRKRD
jgi:DNA-directed RNA polymerase subunit beta